MSQSVGLAFGTVGLGLCRTSKTLNLKPWGVVDPAVLGSSGVVISGAISPLIWVISIVTLLMNLQVEAARTRAQNPYRGRGLRTPEPRTLI